MRLGLGTATLLSRLGPFMPALRFVGFAGAVAILVFMVARTAADVDLGAIVWWPLPLALLGASVWWLLGARGWSILLRGRASREDMSMWCRTQVLRYLPGGIWAPASRAIAISGGLLDRISTVAMDNVIALCGALTIGSLALAVDGDLRWLSLAIVIGGPYVAARVLGPRIPAGTTRTLHATWNYLGAFAAYALAAVLVQAAVSGLGDPLAVAGAATIAWGVGFAVIIAPSGAGVRELVYVALLSGTIPTAEATTAALTLRVLTTAAELAVLFLVAHPDIYRRRPGKETTANE